MFDVAVVIWLVGGTVLIKAMLARLSVGRIPRAVFLLSSIVLSITPLLLAQCRVINCSAWYVIVAGVILFWFCILIARVGRAT